MNKVNGCDIVEAWLVVNKIKYKLNPGLDNNKNIRTFWINFDESKSLFKNIKKHFKDKQNKLVVNVKLDTNYKCDKDPILDITILDSKRQFKFQEWHQTKKSFDGVNYNYKLKIGRITYVIISILRKIKKVNGNANIALPIDS